MKECPYCYSPLSEDAIFCSHCGKNLARENLHLHSFSGNDSKNRKDFCPHCFELIEPAWSLCSNCGTKLKSKKAAPTGSQHGKHSTTRKAHSHINAKLIIIILVVLLAVLVEEYLPHYTQSHGGTLQEEIAYFADKGWQIVYVD